VVSWKDQEEHLFDLIEDLIIDLVAEAVPRSRNAEWDPEALERRVKEQLNVEVSLAGAAPDVEKLQLDIFNVAEKKLKAKFELLGDDLRSYVQWLYLTAIDQLWKDHLLQMDHLRQGIHLRGYGQKDPKIEYKKEGFELFQIMKGRIAASTVATIMRVEPVQREAPPTPMPPPKGAPSTGPAPAHGPGRPRAAASGGSGGLPALPQRRAQRTTEGRGDSDGNVAPVAAAPVQRTGPRVGRNDPCPCGSGKKYKKCHLPLEEGGAGALDT
jgi:preprotein translocase subunit SecA